MQKSIFVLLKIQLKYLLFDKNYEKTPETLDFTGFPAEFWRSPGDSDTPPTP